MSGDFRVVIVREALWERLDELNMTIKDLARKCGPHGRSPGYIYQIISWKRSPGAKLRAELMAVLGLTYDELFKRIPKARKTRKARARQPAPKARKLRRVPKQRKGRRATKARRLVPTDRTYPEMPERDE